MVGSAGVATGIIAVREEIFRALGPRPTGRSRAAAPRVLYVDGHPMGAQMTAHVLRGEGIEIDIALDLDTAVQQLRARCFDVVLIDSGLPEAEERAAVCRIAEALVATGRPTAVRWVGRQDGVQDAAGLPAADHAAAGAEAGGP